MPNRSTIAIIVLTLSALIFTVSSETAYKLEQRRYFNYANPTYILNVITALGAACAGLICILDLHREAERKLRKKQFLELQVVEEALIKKVET
jgi:hypothetical protein